METKSIRAEFVGKGMAWTCKYYSWVVNYIFENIPNNEYLVYLD